MCTAVSTAHREKTWQRFINVLMHTEADMFSSSFVKLFSRGCFEWKLTQTEGVSFLFLLMLQNAQAAICTCVDNISAITLLLFQILPSSRVMHAIHSPLMVFPTHLLTWTLSSGVLPLHFQLVLSCVFSLSSSSFLVLFLPDLFWPCSPVFWTLYTLPEPIIDLFAWMTDLPHFNCLIIIKLTKLSFQLSLSRCAFQLCSVSNSECFFTWMRTPMHLPTPPKGNYTLDLFSEAFMFRAVTCSNLTI